MGQGGPKFLLPLDFVEDRHAHTGFEQVQLARARYDLTTRRARARAACLYLAKLRPPRLDAVPQQRAHEVGARRPVRVDDEDGRPLLERLGDAGAERGCEARRDEAVGDEQQAGPRPDRL